MKSRNTMLRNSRTPTLLLVGLIVVIIIITYNYWSLLENNAILRDNLVSSEEKHNSLLETISNLEKQNSLSQDRIKYFEDKLQTNVQSISQKDFEIDDLNTKLKTKTQEVERLFLENKELQDKLNQCLTSKTTGLTDDERKKFLLIQSENQELRLNLSLSASQLIGEQNVARVLPIDCTQQTSEALGSFKSRLALDILNLNVDKNITNKVLNLFSNQTAIDNQQVNLIEINNSESYRNTSGLANLGQFPAQLNSVLLNSNQTLNLTIEVCKLGKDFGTCDNYTDRFYYDTESSRCLIFSYRGCGGNLNNFKTIQECESLCFKSVLSVNPISLVSLPVTNTTLNSTLNLTNSSVPIQVSNLNVTTIPV